MSKVVDRTLPRIFGTTEEPDDPRFRITSATPDIEEFQEITEGMAEAQSAAAVASIIGDTFDIIPILLKIGEGDVHWKLCEMKGAVYPYGKKKKYKGGEFIETSVIVGCYVSGQAFKGIGARFKIEYQYNEHAVGNIVMHIYNEHDEPGWGLHVEAKMNPIKEPERATSGELYSIVEIIFIYRFTRPIGNPRIYIQHVRLLGGFKIPIVKGEWTQ